MKSNHTSTSNPMNNINLLRQTLKPYLKWQRLQKFLREFNLDYYVVAKLVIAMMEIPEPSLYA